MIKVGVLGAAGKMGQTVCAAVEADPELDLVARVDPALGADRDELVRSGAEVAVDFTQPDQVMDNIRFCVEHGVHVVVGTTGLSASDLDEVQRLAAGGESNVFVAPNFSIGAVLSMVFARRAAPFFGSAEVVEQHHNEKLDAPSGTALRTAEGIADAWREHGRPGGGEPAEAEQEVVPGARGGDVRGVRVHGVRLRGRVAHQEVLFGGPGEGLSIRHDSFDRVSFMPGVLLAVKRVASRPGLTVGLEALLDL